MVRRPERDFDLVVDRPRSRGHRTVVAELVPVAPISRDPRRRRDAQVAPDDLDPKTRYVLTDYDGGDLDGLPNVTSHQWADEHAGFLAGVAAASSTETGTVAVPRRHAKAGQEDYRAGFESGVRAIDPDITCSPPI